MALLVDSVQGLLVRDLQALRKEIEAYPSDADLWREVPGIANPAGVLAHHCAGNLRHYVGALLGGTSYRRDRAAEFARRDLNRAELLQMLRDAEADVTAALAALPDEALERDFPELVSGVTRRTGDHLIRTAVHLGYHLGQVNYHRRILTGGGTA